MRAFSFAKNNSHQEEVLPTRSEIEKKINNKLILVRSFIDQIKGDLNKRAKNEDDVMDKIRGLRKLDEEWMQWEETTKAELSDPQNDPDLIRFRVQDEMNHMLDKIEQFEN